MYITLANSHGCRKHIFNIQFNQHIKIHEKFNLKLHEQI